MNCLVKNFVCSPLRSSLSAGVLRPDSSLIEHIQLNFVRGKKSANRPVLKFPLWHLKKERVQYPEKLTPENAAFVKEVTHDKFGAPAILSGLSTYQTRSPLREPPFEKGLWTETSRRSGLIARKIGCYPMWNHQGKIVWSTLLQVVDNHVVKYIPPEENNPVKKTRRRIVNKLGALLIGAESVDPQKYTKEYCGLFAEAGLPPKRVLTRFHITPNAALQPGTPLFATHFRPGDVVDVAGMTIDHGFQGVMKRWGFKGMPASHGVTKTHRRGGNIGGGGEKGRVWPGTKMPGHMGNRRRVNRGLQPTAGPITKSFLSAPLGHKRIIYSKFQLSTTYGSGDMTISQKFKEAPHFPTFYPEDLEDPLPEDLYHEDIHVFDAPTITFEEKK